MDTTARVAGLILRNTGFALALLIAGISGLQAAPPLHTVTSIADTNDGVCDVSDCTLREAMGAALLDNGWIAFSSLFDTPQTINLTGVLPDIANGTKITGPGAHRLTVRRSSGGDYRIFTIPEGNSATISGLTISNGKSGFGAGILVHGGLTLTDAAVTGNQTTGGGGGGIYSDGPGIQVSRSTFSGNTAGEGAGVYVYRYTNASPPVAALINTTVSANTGPGISIASDASGAVDLYVKNGTIAGNTGPGVVTTAVSSAATTHLNNTVLADNMLGSLAVNGFSASVLSTGGNITSDDASGLLPDPGDYINQVLHLAPLGNYGGPTQTQPPQIGSPAINHGTFQAISTDQRGVARPQGGTFDSGAVELRPLVVTTVADSVDGVCDSSCTLRDAITVANADGVTADDISFDLPIFVTINLASALPDINTDLAIAGPGAVWLDVHRNTGGNYSILHINPNTVVNVSGLTLSNGLASYGGGVNNYGFLTISDSTIRDNHANGNGGGIHSTSQLVISNSTISNNSSSIDGAGVYSYANPPYVGAARLQNTTISGNTATGGGAVMNISFNAAMATMDLLNCTIAGNSAANGGAVLTSDSGGVAYTTIKNTLIADNTPVNLYVENANAVIHSDGTNLSSDDGAGVLVGAGDKINTQPLLLPLGLYGGLTETHLLQSGSPAIEAGNNSGAPPTDQRGITRPQGLKVDIGAVELADAVFKNGFE